ncbi:MAG: RIP metalloprotease, partial [Thermoleophilia bacterium]|nr:RIP metalloprotease [Thermoleophilia bacterium]
LMAVGAVGEGAPAAAAGIRTGDAFARLGDVQWPSVDDGMRQISSPGRKKIAVTVLRAGRLIDMGEVELRDRRIGIDVTTTANTASYVTRFPVGKVSIAGKPRTDRFPAEAAEVPAGSRIVRIGDTPTPTLRDVRWVMQQLIAAAQGGPVEIALTIEPPLPPGQTPVTASRVLRLTPDDAAAVAALGWESPIPASWFELEEIVIQRTNPLAAVGKGLDETRKMLLTTYLTFARLFQGSVKVEHLKGPIGIADVGTRLAGKGFIWLLFFMAAVSVNLAVVNFLPLPIVDGGHFCFLLWEQFTGRPVSVAVQNVSALVGLAVIGAVFLLTTYNDLANLLWR